MKLIRVLIAVLFLCGLALSQEKPSSSPTPNTEQPSNSPYYRVGKGVTPPRALYSPNPVYPESARKTHLSGITVLWAIVGKDGLPYDLKVVTSLSPELDQSALDSVKRWRFVPAKKDGKPVPVGINVEVAFRPD